MSYSLTKAPATTRRRAALGGRRMNGFMFITVTRNYVINGFLPSVVWYSLSFLVFFDTIFWTGVLNTVLHRCCVGHSERRLLAAAFGPALLSALQVNHPIRGVLRTVFLRFRTCHSKRRSLAAAFGSAFSSLDVDHPIRVVLQAVLHCFRTCHSK